MYGSILKRDLRRKKTMNLILFILIILAAMFIVGSVNNICSVTTAVDGYFEKAHVPDYWAGIFDEKMADQVMERAEKENWCAERQKLLYVEEKNVLVGEGETPVSRPTVFYSGDSRTNKVFTESDELLSEVKRGELYAPASLFGEGEGKLSEGVKVKIKLGEKEKTLTVKGKTKDALFGSSMLGFSRFMLHPDDYKELAEEVTESIYGISMYGDGADWLKEEIAEGNVSAYVTIDRGTAGMLYVMDMILAIIVVVVGVCLVLACMVVLRFTIRFTLSEEFREIGVMKAIGISNRKIRGLYIVKYCAISVAGACVGGCLGMPFGQLMLYQSSQNIIIETTAGPFLSIGCSLGVVVLNILFSYFCTKKIKKISPVAAIRNGENGERYRRKGILHLSRNQIVPVVFMACNDILSEFRRFISLLIIFTLGVLLLIIPVNTINTLQSDRMLGVFNMAFCDHVMDDGEVSYAENRKDIEQHLAEIKEKLGQRNIPANVYQEVMFRMSIAYGEEKCTSLAFQGVGDVTADQYEYLEGTPPEYEGEAAISHVIAKNIGASIGDTVEIDTGKERHEYMVTAIFQSMNNMGEGIRFYQEEPLDYGYVQGAWGIQIAYTDAPDHTELERRHEVLQELYPQSETYTAGQYVNVMMGDAAGQVKSVKTLILYVILILNMLVTLLMAKSFITKEKAQIAMMKAIGFRSKTLILWQMLRIAAVQVIAIVIGTAISAPASELSAGQVFRIMGASSVKFAIAPKEVFGVYPLAILAATCLASCLAALRIRKIKPSDAAGAE